MIDVIELKRHIDCRNILNDKLCELRKDINENNINIEGLCNDKEFIDIISNSLEHKLCNTDRLSESNHRRYIDYPLTFNGKIVNTDSLIENSKFYPLKDKWKFVNLEIEDNKYRVQVECIKNREYIHSTYVIDTFWTDWININN